LLWRIILHRVCNYLLEEGASGLAVKGLVPAPESAEGESAPAISKQGDGLDELAALLDASVVGAVNTCPSPELLQPVVAALTATVGQDEMDRPKELGPSGILLVTRVAMVASMWLAQMRRASRSREDVSDSVEVDAVEDVEDITIELQSVWQALSKPNAAPAASRAARSRASPELSELLQDIHDRFAALQAKPQAPKAPRCSLQEELPPKLARQLAATLQFKQVRVARSSASAQPEPDLKTRSFLGKVGKLLEYAAWIALLSGAAVAVSADGFGFWQFHIVPPAWRPFVQAFIVQKAIRVEELLAERDPSAEIADLPSADAVTVGPYFQASSES
jgi:hypothetical protein